MLRTTMRRGLALAAVAIAAAFAAAAIAPHGNAGRAVRAIHFATPALTCGATIDVSTKLTSDLTGCAGTGLTITADHVLLDLNGHTISGTGNATGVAIGAASDTVENGLVQDFVKGITIAAGPTSGGRVQAIRSIDNVDGIDVNGDNAVVTASFVAHNASNGIGVIGNHDQLTNNWIRSNQGRGILVTNLATAATVSGNKVLSNALEGVFVNNAPGSVVTSNTANANGSHGIEANGPVSVSKNAASFNTGAGIDADWLTTDGGGNHAAENGKLHQCENLVCS